MKESTKYTLVTFQKVDFDKNSGILVQDFPENLLPISKEPIISRRGETEYISFVCIKPNDKQTK